MRKMALKISLASRKMANFDSQATLLFLVFFHKTADYLIFTKKWKNLWHFLKQFLFSSNNKKRLSRPLEL